MSVLQLLNYVHYGTALKTEGCRVNRPDCHRLILGTHSSDHQGQRSGWGTSLKCAAIINSPQMTAGLYKTNRSRHCHPRCLVPHEAQNKY